MRKVTINEITYRSCAQAARILHIRPSLVSAWARRQERQRTVKTLTILAPVARRYRRLVAEPELPDEQIRRCACGRAVTAGRTTGPNNYTTCQVCETARAFAGYRYVGRRYMTAAQVMRRIETLSLRRLRGEVSSIRCARLVRALLLEYRARYL